MTIAEIKTSIASFMKRDATSFVKNGFDALDQAVKNARVRVQREHDWEYNRTSIDVSIAAGSFWTIAPVTDIYSVASVDPKKFERAYLLSSSGGLTPLKIVTRAWVAEHEDKRLDTESTYEGQSRAYVVRHGDKFTFEPDQDTATSVRFDIVRWAKVLADGEADFLTSVCYDLVLYYAVMELNLFIKDDDRVAISTGFYKAALASAKMWDLDQNENITNEYIID
jgi:hypothetical protein